MRRSVLIMMLVVAGFALPATANASLQYGSHGPAVLALQRKLVALKYLAPVASNGLFGYRTEQAVMAFQGWKGLTRDGIAGRATYAKLRTAHIPYPWTRAYRHVEVHRIQQVALLVVNRKVIRAIHVSTGRPGLATPAGNFHIFRKERMSWSQPFQVWLPLASYFYGGDAFHQYPDVPGYPASHGCIRVPKGDATFLWYFARLGTRVLIR
jgi:Putative peptidoglycan binding domain/L,D-transpeptidase catalytic domain